MSASQKTGKQTKAATPDPGATSPDTPSILDEFGALIARPRAWAAQQRDRARGIVRDSEAVLEVLDKPEEITLTEAGKRLGSLLKRLGF